MPSPIHSLRGLMATFFALALAGDAGDTHGGTFFQDPSPTPTDESQLNDIAASSSGRIAAVGFERTYMLGGSPGLPLIVEKTGPDGSWSIHDNPNLGFTWHDLDAVEYLPGHPDEDFVAVGWYYPDPLMAHPDGVVMRYRRAVGTWDLQTFLDPGSDFLFTRDIAFDPFDPDRILICGVRGISDPYGGCFQFRTLIVSFRLDTLTYEVLPTTARGALHAITALPDGRFVAFGVAAGECDYIGQPITLLVDGPNTEVLPNPPPWPGHPNYQFNGCALMDDGRVMVVGHGSALGASYFVTLAYRLDPTDGSWEAFKPVDPDTSDHPTGYKSQLFGVTPGQDGRVYAVGRYHYIHGDGRHHNHALVESFDGASWRLEETPEVFDDSYDTQLWNACTHRTAGVWAAGWYDPDDYEDKTLVLRQGEGATGVEPRPVADSARCDAYPNPFTGSTSFRLASAPSEDMTIAVYDLAGRCLRRLTPGPSGADWDGRDAAGRPVAAGVYHARVHVGGHTVSSVRIVKLR